MNMLKLPHGLSNRVAATMGDEGSKPISRISDTSEPLGMGRAAATSVGEGGEPRRRTPPQIPYATVKRAIDARRLRKKFFGFELFADPAWDMLLQLFLAEISQRRVSVTSLTIAAEVPATTALRWIKTMTDAAIIRRRADPTDGRRIFVELSANASEAMEGYFEEVQKTAA